jgi:hypothetical protein
MTDNNTPICYAYLTGWLEQTIRGLTYDLISKGLVDKDQKDTMDKLMSEKIERAIEAEREHSKNYPDIK